MKIIFWENIISQHKVSYWNHLITSSKISKFILVVEEALSNDLKQQGWENALSPHPKLEVIIRPASAQIHKILKENIEDSYHIFSGIRANPMVFTAFKMSWAFPVHRILLTECVNLNGARRLTRRLASVFIERKYLKQYDIVLGSGSNTKTWYLECGVKHTNFFPFMYAIESQKPKDISTPVKPLRFIFIGQLVKRKGLDVLIKALAELKHPKWTLDIYGTGDLETDLKEMVKSNNLEQKVTFNGVVSNQLLKTQMHTFHCLVLPSRFDGWGAVINEAIAAGLKVICSDRCGASILLVNPKIGKVFPGENHKALAHLLKAEINNQEQVDRNEILAYSEYIKGKRVAEYFIEILEYHYKNIGNRPLPPWEKYLQDQNNHL